MAGDNIVGIFGENEVVGRSSMVRHTSSHLAGPSAIVESRSVAVCDI